MGRSLFRIFGRRTAVVCLITATALAAPRLLTAATTGATSLHTPQGSDAGTANGDYVSDTGGMNTVYRYFIEVPPGVSRLVVEMFDPDIGLGGANEDIAGRDRDRGNTSPSYNTSATYSLFNPAGSTRTTSFTAGSLMAPAGSDNAWTTFFDSTGDDYRDNFGAVAYNNSDGLVSWTANSWTETNDDNNAGNGEIRITGGELRLGDNGSIGANAARIERQADLSAFGGATFSFNLRTQGVEANDQYRVEVSSNGGGAWTTLETFTGAIAATTRSYDISAYRATNTRIRFIHVLGYTATAGGDFLFVDNLRIQDTRITPGHWELRVDMDADNDIDAIGIRAHDGTSGSGGTELNVYFDSMAQFGANPPASGTTSRSYTIHPYVSAGCTAYSNDFDYDSNRGSVGSLSYSSRTGAFSQSVASASLSTDDNWRRSAITGWTSDTDSLDYGIWTGTVSISSYLVGTTPNGNYTTFYMSNSQAADPAVTAPTANPTTNAFRVYLPTDAGAAPVKAYVEQLLRWDSGPNPPQVGQTSRFAVTVRVVNPTSQSITFSASNLVTANVPGSGAVYGGAAQVSQGSIVSQPSVGGTGNITWNPGSLAAGATALLAYEVAVTPTSSGQRIAATATPASGNGTRATFVDETGNTTQTRATYTFGPLCELAVTQGLLTQAVISSFHTYAAGDRGEGGVQVEWTTASEAGTAGFNLSRWDDRSKSFVKVHDGLLPGLIHAPQGGTYRFVDEGAAPGSVQTWLLEEVEVAGGRQRFGPFTARPSWDRPEKAVEAFEREPHAGLKLAIAEDTGEIRQIGEAAKGAGADGIRLAIRENGLYYLTASQVATGFGTKLDEIEKAIAKGRLLLTRNGVPAAWYPDYADARLKTGRGLFFYGETVDSLYTRDTVYRLRQSKDGITMQEVPVAPAAAAPGGSFPASQPSEVDSFPATAISPDPESDYWFWAFLVGGDPTFGHKAFTLDAPGLAPGDGALTVNLQGATDTHVAGEHRAAVSLNGTPLGELQWQGIAPQQGTFPVPAGLLQPTGNQVEVTATVGDGAPFSILYVDGFRLGYPRTFAAAGDTLAFTGGGNPGGPVVTATGFSGPAVQLLDVSDPLRPRWLKGPTVEADAGSYRLSFIPSPVSRYLAVGPGAVKAPAAVRPWNAADLLSTANRADVLIVVPAGFEAAAERLAALRRSQGLEALVVNLDQVADNFGEGAATPQALKAFLRFAKLGWAVPPRYVVLAGEGSLDYRNLQGYGDCVMPPLMIQGEGGLFPSDNRFADTTGDGLPDMALGRLPVLTAAELNAYVDKILAYEASGAPAWASSAMVLADSPDGAADFSADSDRIASLLPAGSVVDRIYLSGLPLATARAELLQGIQDGASWVNYLGHGGLDRFSASGLLTSADVAGLTNGSRLPVVTAMTCTINRFAVPGAPSLGEILVKSPSGGAAAVWGPSGLSYHGEARQLAEVFYRLVSEPGESNGRLGDSVIRALAEYGGLGGDGRMLDIYNLLGDPALVVRRGPAPAVNGGGSGE